MAGVSNNKKPLAEINVVPFIDIMLVLLVVFMITAPLITISGLNVDLPQATANPLVDDQQDPLIVSIDANGAYYIALGQDEKQPKPLAVIAEQVGKVIQVTPTTPVFVWGDESVPYGKVIALMGELQQAGAPSVNLAIEPPN